MKRCTQCFYGKRTALATYEPVMTCLHPKARTPVGYPMICGDARTGTAFCGPEGSGFMPTVGTPHPVHFFRQ